MSETVEICSGVHWVGSRHPELTVFDELFPTRCGTTYNSYLIKGSEKIALIDTVKGMFADAFLDKLREHVDLGDIDLVVVNHTEPDHSGALGKLLEANPHVQIYCTKAGEKFLEQLYNRSLNTVTVTEGQTLELGGKTLQFVLAPSLHWPDTMFTYLPEDGLLFSCDAFGAHYCGEGLYNDETGAYSTEFAFYFDSIMRPFKEKVREAVAKVEKLDIAMICPSHGPILRSNPMSFVRNYAQWSKAPDNGGRARVLLLTLSPHGNTRTMARTIEEVLQARGIDTVAKAAYETPDNELRDEIERADALLVGTPTINRDAPPPIWRALSLLSSVTPKGRKAAVFGSFGWSGEAVKLVEDRLKGVKFKLMAEGLCYRFHPTEENLQECREFAGKLADSLLSQG